MSTDMTGLEIAARAPNLGRRMSLGGFRQGARVAFSCRHCCCACVECVCVRVCRWLHDIRGTACCQWRPVLRRPYDTIQIQQDNGGGDGNALT
jgi:hypothetical protein